jgi:CTP:phosphocholine cytidylyltransferase-like protein
MNKPEVIILAAGYGSRLQNLLQGKPKPLIEFENEPLLYRTVRQFHEIDFKNIKVVVGYKKDEVASSIKSYFPSTQIIYNDRYEEDRNIYSLICALRNSNSSTIIIEGDVALSDRALPVLQNSITLGNSFWTSCGFFKSHQHGGIIKADHFHNIEQVLYTSYSCHLKNYYKNLGLIFCNANDILTFKILLDEYASKSLDQYYMTPWSDNFINIPAKLIDIGENGGASFNTIQEYNYAVNLISNT